MTRFLLLALLIPTVPVETPPRPPAYVSILPDCAPGAMHMLQAVARDAAGNETWSEPVYVCVENGGRREPVMRREP